MSRCKMSIGFRFYRNLRAIFPWCKNLPNLVISDDFTIHCVKCIMLCFHVAIPVQSGLTCGAPGMIGLLFVLVREDGCLGLRLASDLLEEVYRSLEHLIFVECYLFRLGIEVFVLRPAVPETGLLTGLRIGLVPDFIVPVPIVPLIINGFLGEVIIHRVDEAGCSVHVLQIEGHLHPAETFSNDFLLFHNLYWIKWLISFYQEP